MDKLKINTLVASRLMGWKVFAGEPGYGRPPGRISLVLDALPDYCNDSVAVAEMERVIQKFGMWDDYIVLADELKGRYNDPFMHCCVAALEAAGVDVEG